METIKPIKQVDLNNISGSDLLQLAIFKMSLEFVESVDEEEEEATLFDGYENVAAAIEDDGINYDWEDIQSIADNYYA